MRKTKALLIMFLLIGLMGGVNARSAENTIKVTIIVEGVKSDKGNISIGFYNNAATAFDPSSSVYGVHLPAKKGSVRHTFDIVPGSYAIGVIHDENGNGVLDYNFLGIPSEGYGFSGTATRKNYEKALVKIEKSGNIVIQLR